MTSTYTAFGLALTTPLELPLDRGPADGRPRVELALRQPGELDAGWSGTLHRSWSSTFPGGREVVVERGRDGDQRIAYGERARFHLTADAGRIDWAGDPGDPSTLRFLLDTVLWWTALANGLHLLHAGAVELGGAVVALIAASGGGKSTLAGELLRRGATLFSDDVLAVDDQLVAHPGPPLMNVAAGRPDLHALGRRLADLAEGDEEAWIAVDRAPTGPRPLKALVLYSRGQGLELGCAPEAATALDLIPHAWVIPDDPEAARDRFGFAGDLASRVPVLSLTAGGDATPAEIADALRAGLDQHTAAHGIPGL